MNRRKRSLRHGCYSLFSLSFFLILGTLQADEMQLVRVRKGDTISYLSFKIYGMYDPNIQEILRRENPQVKDMNLIYPGQSLRFPPPEAIRKVLPEKKQKAAGAVPGTREGRPPPEPPAGKESESSAQIRAHQAVVTFLEGQVQVKKAGASQWTPARPNMILSVQDRIKTLSRSRVELILDNQSVTRLSENTLLTIERLEEERATGKEAARVELSLGRLWTRTARLFNPSLRYEVRTPTAIAGVQGTIYQMRVSEDGSTSIQVFQGEVGVYNPFPTAKPPISGPPSQVGKPQEIPGPAEVPGPAAISREEWTKIVLRQFQQITVTERDISRPAPFDVQKERQSEWVRWNEERDTDFQPPARPPR